ncbi:Gfo/Idh/MocA family protein [Paenibacillus piri]|uniref:Gfo/Idh/MocA family protein n=1 Tax=Paenibacillus piri TaxID=2547395 RepID=UPI0014050AFF|nr:Gfo/Idh/MocA family oxidoreductase [Paenibacillus piri]
MNKAVYGFAIVGSGAIGSFHAEQLKQVGGAKLIAVCDENPQRAGQFAERYSCSAYTSLNDMLQRDDIDIVNICTPSSLHGGQAIACAKAGKHVIVEKPMDITLATADSMIAACQEAGTKLSVVSQHRLDRSVAQVKQLIREGAFGKLVLAAGAVHWYRSQQYYDSSSWRGTWQWDGGGALMNQGIHIVDLLQYLMGPVESVQAQCRTLGHRNIEVEDTAAALLRFGSGAVGTLTATTSAYPGLNTRIELFGTKGSAIIENDSLVFCQYEEAAGDGTITDAVGSVQHRTSGANGASNPMSISGETHRLQFSDMIEAIEHDREPLVNGIEGRKPLEIILAVYESNRSGKPVLLQPTAGESA